MMDSGEIFWHALKFSCSFIHIRNTHTLDLLQLKVHIPPNSLKHTHLHTLSVWSQVVWLVPDLALCSPECNW